MNELTRREFLKFAGIGLTTALGKRYFDYLHSLEVDNHGPYSSLRPNIRIGFHALTEGEVKPNQVVVAGEMESRVLSVYFADKTFPPYPQETYDLKSPERFTRSTSASDQQINTFRHELRRANELGAILVANDSRYAESVGLNRLVDAERMGAQRAIPAVLSLIPIPIVSFLWNIRRVRPILSEYYREKQKNPDLPMPNVSLLPDSVVDFVKAHPEIQTIEGIVAAVASGITIGNLNPEMVLKVLSAITTPIKEATLMVDERYLAEIIKLTNLRNNSMAHNMRLTQYMLDRYDPKMELHPMANSLEKPDVFFFFGTGHVGTKEAYEKGIEYTTRQLENEAERVIGFWEKEINHQLARNEANLTNALDFWVVATSGFNIPLMSIMRERKYLDGNLGELPLSSRAILWRVLLKRCQKQPDNNGLKKMREALLHEEEAFFNHLDVLVSGMRKHLSESRCQEADYFNHDGKLHQMRIVEGMSYIENIDATAINNP